MQRIKQKFAKNSKKLWTIICCCGLALVLGAGGLATGLLLDRNNSATPKSDTDTYKAAPTNSDYWTNHAEPIDLESHAGTQDDPYLISTPGQLAQLAKYTNGVTSSSDLNSFEDKYFKLTKDLDLSAYYWPSIGVPYYNGTTYGTTFMGNFDGGRHVIKYMICGGQSGYGGLFDQIYGSTIKNIGIDCAYYSQSNYGKGVGVIASTATNSTISNCYVINSYTGGGACNSGIVDKLASNSTVSNCYVANMTMNAHYSPAGISYQGDGTGKIVDCFTVGISYYPISSEQIADHCYSDSIENFKSSTFFTTASNWANGSWDFSKTWTIDSSKNDGYPSFIEPTWADNATPFSTTAHIGNSWDDAYEISTPEQLAYIAQQVNSGVTTYSGKYFKQTKNIKIKLGGYDWVPIGSSYSIYFGGNYDGQNFLIEGLTINTTEDYQGLFGYASGATIKNIELQGGSISGGSYVGSISGYGGNITNCVSNIAIKGADYVGGIVGFNAYNGSCIYCKNKGNITATGNNIGGLAGRSEGTLNNCTNSGAVITSGDCVGGICGFAMLSFSNCTNLGDVTGANRVGGLCGETSSGASKCISNATITATGGMAGALLGRLYYGYGGTMSNCSAFGYFKYTGTANTAGLLFGGSGSGSGITITACSFYGTSNKTNLNLYGSIGSVSITRTACWSWCNDTIQVSSSITGDSANWTKYWAVVPGMNYGLPIQKELYAVAEVANSTAAEIAAALPNAQIYA